MPKKTAANAVPAPAIQSGDVFQIIKIDLENCYGIRKLEKEFNFATRLNVIYAPNGSMKSSLAKTFQDLSGGQASTDRIFKKRPNKRYIKNKAGSDIPPEEVFVIEPFNRDYLSKKISTLLVNKDLKNEYDKIHSEIDDKKDSLLKELKKSSGLKNPEEVLSVDIAHDPKEFFKSLSRIESEVMEDKQAAFKGINYDKVLNDKVVQLLETKEFKDKLTEYIKVYENLISQSKFFRQGIFNHNNAAEIAKNLNDNGFFKAEHSVSFNNKGIKQEVKTVAELEAVIKAEKDSILSNPELSKSFEDIDKKIAKNKECKDFRECIQANQFMLAELNNLPLLREKLWVAYLGGNVPLFKDLMETYSKGKRQLDEIVKKAKEESTKWKKVIDIFNSRFSVPFIVNMVNQHDVILRQEAPSIQFSFKDPDGGPEVTVPQNDLWGILSMGERRALYILNIIFEVQARIESKQRTLFIVDDIADSFDYKNKYAIIEYLSDISKIEFFYQLILTHNFDFFRNITSRLQVYGPHALHTIKTDTMVKLVEERYRENPFKEWKDNLTRNEMLIAAIPFVRNLAEYCEGKQSNYDKLTSLLHIKPDTDSILVGDLEAILKKILTDKSSTLNLADKTKKVKELIYETADRIFAERDEIIDLEKKIVLSIAIRLKLEEFLIKEIDDAGFVRSIKRNQTIVLIRKYKEKFPSGKEDEIKLAERVNLMTPENIHINSFMYEPILDMSSEHLKRLYKDVTEA
ncbi:MAG: hypothetical protein MOGMAGMI_01642 [Candidatus Omnitrophica bacterium]|nr:hypothetical protein [Candidatus Omnitrophota bacterium]